MMIIYFIQEEKDGPVKIGKTVDLERRMAVLQTGCPRKLNVLYSFEVPDEKADYAEKHIHACFSNRSMRGEWFLPCPYMYDYIKTIKETGFFHTWDEIMQDVFDGDKFSELYNKTFLLIEETWKYGDKRRIESLIFDLQELLDYAKRAI